MDNDIDTPAPLTPRDVNGEPLESGAFVVTLDDPDEDGAGEVWGAIRGRVLVSWPEKVQGGYRYVEDWHDADDLLVVR